MIDQEHRLAVIGLIAIVLFGALVARLGYLQTVETGDLRGRADAIANDRVLVPTIRGRILDRNGVVLVDNLAINVVRIDPNLLPHEERAATLTRLANLLRVPYSKLEERLAKPDGLPYQPIEVARRVRESEVVYIEEHRTRFPGVSTAQVAQRTYPQGNLAAHVLGYVGKINQQEIDKEPDDLRYSASDVIGKSGVERSFERELRGMPGEDTVVRDSSGVVRQRRRLRQPVVGRDVRLTIDVTTQRLAETSLSQGLVAARRNVDVGQTDQAIRATAGAVVVLDPRNGDVLAMASYPTYDPSDFVPSISRERFQQLYADPAAGSPLTNRAVTGLYPPGSTFKIFTAVAALRAGLVTPAQPYRDEGFFKLPKCNALQKCTWRNAGDTKFGPIALPGAIKVSSDSYFYSLGFQFSQLPEGPDNGIQAAARELGLGTRTNIRLPSERPGAVPDRDYRKLLHDQNPTAFPNGRWTTGDFINLAIGQGEVLTTPLQLARAYAAIANGGTLLQPRIELAVARRQERTGTTPPSVLPVISAATVATASDSPRVPKTTLPPPNPTGNPLLATTPTLPPIIRPPVVLGNVNVPDEIRTPILQGLTDVVGSDTGTASAAFRGFPLDSFPIAGKTGTAQKSGEQDYALFTAFGPVPDPRYVVTVVLEQGGFGRQAAAVSRRVFDGLAGFPINDVETISGAGRER